MAWPTWNEAAIAAVLALALAWVLRRQLSDQRWSAALVPAANEFALVAGLYSIWRIARELPLDREQGAIERAYRIVDAEQSLRLPSELAMQQFVLAHDWLARLTNSYYALLHVPALLIFLVWLFVRHRDQYPHWRNGLVLLTACCLVIRFVRVAPPRFLPDLGYIDLATRYGLDLYGPVGTGISDQFAAMPSIHVGWAAVVSFGVFMVTTSVWRWLVLLHVVVTCFVVAASGNHWWLDGLVAIALLLGCLALDTQVRRRRSRRRDQRRSARDSDGYSDGHGDRDATVDLTSPAVGD
ncbi:MAG: phosphatase PAP2 family protein [Microthrixaceae bacterium]